MWRLVPLLLLCACSRPRAPQTSEVSQGSSTGCLSCHAGIETPTMHLSPAVDLGCTDCHGGDGLATEKEKAHVRPPEGWVSSANPERLASGINRLDPEFIRFVNPGDLRVAGVTCGRCHAEEVRKVRKSMMAHGAMLWGAALYNNGVVPFKDPRFGEAYAPDGTPVRMVATGEPDAARGELPWLDPLPRFEVGQPGNILRVFERGGRFLGPIPGLANPLQEPGKPDKGLSPRGLGTGNRTDPVWLNLQKTRLLDPMLWMLGTNDHPGDYRSSGCTACHVLYANDRDPVHSGALARHGNEGMSASGDPTIPKGERGHPVHHTLTSAIPTSQCIVCHIHPGTTVTNTYLGTIWWDNETEAKRFYPEVQRDPTEEERLRSLERNPEEAAARGLWSDYEFLKRASEMNPTLGKVQLADFHGHGWLFRNVYKRDLAGNLLDEHGRTVSPDDPERFRKAVHLRDIHLERGMHCVDCHFEQDSHGSGALHGSVRDAVEIRCEDCHGTIAARATLRTSGPAAPPGGHDLSLLRTPHGKRRFQRSAGRIVQRSMVDGAKEWTVPQIADREGNPLSWYAKTVQRDNRSFGDPAAPLAHDGSAVTCFACHSSWVASCFGCHLPMRANQKTPYLHNEGDFTRNFTPYNFQTVRADTFMLGIDGDVTGNRVAPARSACAVLVGSQNTNREWVYSQQQTVSAEGFSGIAFSTHVPHTVRKTETKTCTDCHLSAAGDNNALMAQLLMQGTGFMNFMFRWVYVGTEGGVEAIVVTERDEPQAVIGSSLHEAAYPANHRRHAAAGRQLDRDHVFHSTEGARSVQLRGEYLYVADGPGGLRILDVAQIDQKGFSERIVTAPVSPLDQRLFVATKDAACVASPSTMAVDPTRTRFPENREQAIHPLYAYLYVADRAEGLVLTTAATLLDGNPRNNVIERAVTFNPEGLLDGASFVTVAGRFAYVGCDKGLVIVDVNDPLRPAVAAVMEDVRGVRGVTVQFRYAFVACEKGLLSIEVTPEADGSFCKAPRIVSEVAIAEARQVYVARTYAYVAGGREGLWIVDVTRPEEMRPLMRFDGGGAIDDCNDVKIGITNTSLFAYLADGENGLRVVQLTDPERQATAHGFSPVPEPRLIATFRTKHRALCVSRGLDRDRAVDESGNQLAVFGRVGARPFTFAEMARLYRLPGGEIFFPSPPR